MFKHWRLLSILLLTIGSIGVWLAIRDPISKSSFDSIQDGMSEAEVERLLGGPSGDYRSRKSFGFRQWKAWGDTGDGTSLWLGDSLFIYVSFDANQRVVGASATEVGHLEETLPQKLKRWFRF